MDVELSPPRIKPRHRALALLAPQGSSCAGAGDGGRWLNFSGTRLLVCCIYLSIYLFIYPSSLCSLPAVWIWREGGNHVLSLDVACLVMLVSCWGLDGWIYMQED